MKLIVGLGNPGAKYTSTRHNIGFILLDALADHYGQNWRVKFQGEEQKISIDKEDVILLKPQTFMNLSGQSVGAAAQFYKIKPADILVLHDELDLKPGQVKLKMGGGHAGHNGLRSIISQIGTDFERLRIGIGHPGEKSQVSNYVLHDFAKSDQDWIADLQNRLPEALPHYLSGQASRFMETLKATIVAKKSTPNRAIPKPAPKDEPKPHSPFDALKSFFKSE